MSALLVIGICISSVIQPADSVKLKIYNARDYTITKYSVTIGGQKYRTDLMKPKSYSPSFVVPYAQNDQETDITFIVKSFLKKRQQVRLISNPIDFLGKKITKGNCVLKVYIRKDRESKSYIIENELVESYIE